MSKIHCNGKTFETIAAIVFDKDGTLADSRQFLIQLGQRRADQIEAIVPCLRTAILKAFGIKNNHLDPTGLLAVGNREENEIAIAALIAQLGYGWIEAKAIAQSAFNLADQSFCKAEQTPLFPGVAELVRSLSSLKLAVLSSDSQTNVEEFVEHYNLKFQLLMGARSGISKPDPKLIYLVCEALSVSPKQTLVIGDTIADLYLAQRAGAHCIGVTWGGSTIKQLKTADVLADCPSDIQLSD